MNGFVCGGPPASGPRLFPVDFTARYAASGCCMGSWEEGPRSCTCWEPVYDLKQRHPDVTAEPKTRTGKCDDCAYRENSPERQADPYALVDIDVFYCHKGIRRPKEWRHPDGRVRPGDPADYQPPVVNRVPYKANGQPALRCGGWAATQ